MLATGVETIQETITFRVEGGNLIHIHYSWLMNSKYLYMHLYNVQYNILGAVRLPSSVMVITITSSSATIQWMLTEPYNASCPETFTVYYGMSSRQLNLSTPEITASTASQTYATQINSLQPATVYFYTIQSENKFTVITTDVMSFITNEKSKLYDIATDEATYNLFALQCPVK